MASGSLPKPLPVPCPGRLHVEGGERHLETAADPAAAALSRDLHVLRDQVSMVLQKNVLFSGTIKENLRWGDENATIFRTIKTVICRENLYTN